MAVEQVLYAQAVNILRNGLELIAVNKNKNEAQFKFQGQSETSQRCFDLDFDWTEVSFITHEHDSIKKCVQSHDDTQNTNTFKIFQVPI